MTAKNDDEPLITDAEFEVVEGPYRPVEPDPYESLSWWQKAVAEGASLFVFLGGLALLILVATVLSKAIGSGYDKAAHAVIEAVN